MLKYTDLYLQLDQSNRKNVFDTVDHFESLSEYYHDKFTNFFRVKNLICRLFLIACLLQINISKIVHG